MTELADRSTIDFGPEQWERIRDSHRLWWDGELGRPLIQMRLGGAKAPRPEPTLPSHGFIPFYDDSISAKQIVDRWDYDLSTTRYLGDAYPHIWPDFGPGVAAAFSGAKLECGNRTVWFHPEKKAGIAELSLDLNQNAKWFKRIAMIMETAVEFWQGQVQVGMTDLGGNLDIVSTFRPSEALLFDLYDHPEAVKARTWEAHRLWWDSFEALNRLLQPANPGYTCWTPVFSETPYYILQCDFCYMIGPEMFDEFVKPELVKTCEKLSHSIYHLDGPGELTHLDSLLEIEALDGVQWIPGDGAKPISEWPEVYRKISDAGKKIQLFGSLSDLAAIVEQTGRADNIVLIANGSSDSRQAVETELERYGAM